jgi:hypothetical protein
MTDEAHDLLLYNLRRRLKEKVTNGLENELDTDFCRQMKEAGLISQVEGFQLSILASVQVEIDMVFQEFGLSLPDWLETKEEEDESR